MNKTKVTIKLILLLVIPAALLDTLGSLYNIYVPIYLQAGGTAFDHGSATLTYGFGIGAALVGFWMTADNIIGFIIQPFISAQSDRTKGKLGRRLPFILYSLPLTLLGFAFIPVIPTLIPAELNGQHVRLINHFALFTIACIVFYSGFIPQKILLETLRLEVVEINDRSKIESWATFLMYVFSVISFLTGGILYRIYGPMLFWTGLAVYTISVILLVVFFREPQNLVESATEQENNNLKQIFVVFKGKSTSEKGNIIIFLVSVISLVIAFSGIAYFATSWMVNVLKFDEVKSAGTLSIYIISAALISLPAGYMASGKIGPKNVFRAGVFICMITALLMGLMPNAYIAGLVIYGLGSGIILVTMSPLATVVCGAEKSMGSVIGILTIAYNIGNLLGANVLGWIIQLFSYDAFYIGASIFFAISFALSLFIRVTPQIKSGT